MDLIKGALQNPTIWLNLLGPIFAFLAAHYGFTLTDAQQMAFVTVAMALANFVMEHLTTGLTSKTAAPQATATPGTKP